MKNKIGILTSTRAEYGLLCRLYKKLEIESDIELNLLVTGMHFLTDFGYTFNEIERDSIQNLVKIEIQMNGKDAHEIVATMSDAMVKFSKHFSQVKYDMLVVLGDRYETLAVCIAAMNHQIPIAHIHGGETTEGAMDEAIRHSITKLSYLHFTSLEEYRNRVIQLGEDPKRVYNVGALGVENICHAQLLGRDELSKSLSFALDTDYAVVTYHPVTLDSTPIEIQMNELLNAMDEFSEIKFIVTKANADAGGQTINRMLQQYVSKHENAFFIDSLGTQRYLSALKYCSFILGNSSSGIIEAPSFKITSVNIGDRQKGRLCAESVLNVNNTREEISKGIAQAIADKKHKRWYNIVNPYGDGNTSEKIAKIIVELLQNKNINLKKIFYDINK